MHYPPASRSLLHAEGWTRMWRDTLTHMTRLAAAFEECVNSLDLISRQRPLPCHTILRNWHEINLVPNTTISRKFSRNLVREQLPGSCRASHDCDANRSSRADFGSALRGRVICSSSVTVTASLVIRHTCSTVPPLRSRRKCFQESPGRLRHVPRWTRDFNVLAPLWTPFHVHDSVNTFQR